MEATVTVCHRESVQNGTERLEVGKEAETSARLCQYHRKQCLTWESTAFSGLLCSAQCLFCSSFTYSIVVSAHSNTMLQNWGFLGTRYLVAVGSHLGSRMSMSLLKHPMAKRNYQSFFPSSIFCTLKIFPDHE